ncbi:hypothetical protein [Spirillospora sp. NPDC029432]|uniref:hypothetical protein n=1 Tax=Spirillospora sp. NPDC029432 TaxID=3154599 RepID=UPI00345137C2
MRARPVLFAAGALLALAPACAPHEPRGGTVRPRQVFTLAIGDTARLQGTGLAVTLRDVRDDSRCPVDADCGWPGDATIVVAAADGHTAPAEHEFHTNPLPARSAPPDPDGDRRAARLDGHMLRFKGLAPSRRSGDRVDRGDYRARFALHPA